VDVKNGHFGVSGNPADSKK